MKELHDQQLAFCRIEMFMGNGSGKLTSGWLYDNLVSFSRVMLVYFAPLFNIAQKQQGIYYYITDQERSCKALLVLFYVMICHIMSHIDIDPAVIHEHIKIFMSCADNFHNNSEDIFDNNFWHKKQNFFSLCMLSDQIKVYGPVWFCNDMICEREIQFVKPIIKVLRKTENFKIRMTDHEKNRGMSSAWNTYQVQT